DKVTINEERLPSPQPSGLLGVRAASRVRRPAGAVPARSFLGTGPGARGRGEARFLPALERAATGQVRGNSVGAAARGAPDGRAAAAGAGIPRMARLAEKPAGGRGGRDARRRPRLLVESGLDMQGGSWPQINADKRGYSQRQIRRHSAMNVNE